MQIPVEEIILFASSFIAVYAVYIIASISLNIQRGFAGIPQFGLMFAIAGGAYIIGNLANRVAIWILGIKPLADPILESSVVLGQINPVLASQPLLSVGLLVIYLILGALFGAVLGLIQVGPAIRLRIDYLSITLLAFAEIINVIATAYRPLIGGAYGVQVPLLFGWAGKYAIDVTALVMFIVALIIYAYAEYLARTPLGRTLKAIRDNEITAQSLGKDIVKYRAIAIVLGSAFSGMAGVLWSFYNGAVIPGQYHRFNWTFLPWLMLLLGGIGNNKGVFLGTTIFVTLDRFITYYKHSLAGLLPFDVIWVYQLLIGFITMLILLYKPEGLLPEKPYIPKGVKERIGKLISSEKG